MPAKPYKPCNRHFNGQWIHPTGLFQKSLTGFHSKSPRASPSKIYWIAKLGKNSLPDLKHRGLGKIETCHRYPSQQTPPSQLRREPPVRTGQVARACTIIWSRPLARCGEWSLGSVLPVGCASWSSSCSPPFSSIIGCGPSTHSLVLPF